MSWSFFMFVLFGIIFLFNNNLSANISPHPNITWQGIKPFESYSIEIFSDKECSERIVSDRIENVSRYVSTKPLSPGNYFWRATDSSGGQQSGTFVIDKPAIEILISAGSSMKELKQALLSARTNHSTVIRFEPGTYHFSPGENGTVFSISKTENLIIDGSGALFMIHNIARVAEVSFSKHVTFKNFSVDYAVPVYTAAKVESIEANGTMELSLWPGCVPPESVPSFMEETRGLFYDPAFPRVAENVPLLIYMKEPWKALGNDRYRLQAVKPDDLSNVRTGMVYICAPRHKPQGIELYNSEDITLVDITTYYLPGIGVNTSFVNDLKLIRVKMLRREDRLLGVQNGGTNIHNARIGPWIEGCRFENTGDDCNHVNALMLTPLSQPDSHTVIISSHQPGTRIFSADMDIQTGDTLAFFDRFASKLIVEAVVVSASISNKDTEVIFDREIPELVCGTGLGMAGMDVNQIYNLNRACGNFVFRNNEFVRGRRAGIMAKSGPGLIENNRLEELGGGGVELINVPYEGLYAHDILIKNNIFNRGGLLDKGRSMAAPAIWAEIFHWNVLSQPLHRNIRIIGNVITDYPSHAMEIVDVTNLLITNNTMRITDGFIKRYPEREAIKTENVFNPVLKNNTIDNW